MLTKILVLNKNKILCYFYRFYNHSLYYIKTEVRYKLNIKIILNIFPNF